MKIILILSLLFFFGCKEDEEEEKKSSVSAVKASYNIHKIDIPGYTSDSSSDIVTGIKINHLNLKGFTVDGPFWIKKDLSNNGIIGFKIKNTSGNHRCFVSIDITSRDKDGLYISSEFSFIDNPDNYNCMMYGETSIVSIHNIFIDYYDGLKNVVSMDIELDFSPRYSSISPAKLISYSLTEDGKLKLIFEGQYSPFFAFGSIWVYFLNDKYEPLAESYSGNISSYTVPYKEKVSVTVDMPDKKFTHISYKGAYHTVFD